MTLQEDSSYLTQIEEKISAFYENGILHLDNTLQLVQKDQVDYYTTKLIINITNKYVTITDKETAISYKINIINADIASSNFPFCIISSGKIKINNLIIYRKEQDNLYKINGDNYQIYGSIDQYTLITNKLRYNYNSQNQELIFTFPFSDNTTYVKSISFRKPYFSHCTIMLNYYDNEIRTNVFLRYSNSKISNVNYRRILNNKEVFSLDYQPTYSKNLAYIWIQEYEGDKFEKRNKSKLRITHQDYINERYDCFCDRLNGKKENDTCSCYKQDNCSCAMETDSDDENVYTCDCTIDNCNCVCCCPCKCRSYINVDYSIPLCPEDIKLINTVQGLRTLLKREE